jgi:hypothetical protein
VGLGGGCHTVWGGDALAAAHLHFQEAAAIAIAVMGRGGGGGAELGRAEGGGGGGLSRSVAQACVAAILCSHSGSREVSEEGRDARVVGADTAVYVSSCYCVCVRMLLCMCPRASMYVSAH